MFIKILVGVIIFIFVLFFLLVIRGLMAIASDCSREEERRMHEDE